MEKDLEYIKRQFNIVGNSKKLNRALEVAIQVAPTDMSVLIVGGSGTGKESFSKIIHKLSRYKHGNFIAINCGAIPEGTIDSELFGHEKGAFTGASEERKGYFEEVDGGTIFLDEIGEMPLSTQAKLLRVLEYGEFIRVGSSKVRKLKVRVVAATNVDLLTAIDNKKFREDLYYRLNTVCVNVPSLYEREDDILLLFRKFAMDFSEKYKMPKISLSNDAAEAILKYRFPGNVRELKSMVEQMSILEKERVVSKEVLSNYLSKSSRNISLVPLVQSNASNNDNNSNLPARIDGNDFFYKIIFDLRKDLNSLKQLVLGLINKDIANNLNKNDLDVFHNIGNVDLYENRLADVYNSINYKHQDTGYTDTTRYNGHQINSEVNLSNNEKELIRKALSNSISKKEAANSLGISERTLYRKIKQYQLQAYDK